MCFTDDLVWFTDDFLAVGAVALRADAAARRAKTAAIALTNVPMPAASVPSAVTATQAWPASAIGAVGQVCGGHALLRTAVVVSAELSRNAPESAIPKKTAATFQRDRARSRHASTASSPAASDWLSCPLATIVHRQSPLRGRLASFDAWSSARWPAPYLCRAPMADADTWRRSTGSTWSARTPRTRSRYSC